MRTAVLTMKNMYIGSLVLVNAMYPVRVDIDRRDLFHAANVIREVLLTSEATTACKG